MSVRTLSAVGSSSAVHVIWRHWHHLSYSCWMNQLVSLSTRSPFSSQLSLFPCSELKHIAVLPRSKTQRNIHLSSGLMENSEKEPPLKRRKSTEQRISDQQQLTSNHLPERESRERREQKSAWLCDLTEIPTPQEIPNAEGTLIQTALSRQWENLTEVSPPEPAASQSFDFSVMSYNILSQDLLLSNRYLYKHCQPLILEWQHRFSNIIKELERYGADIMCLQEVQEDHYKKQIKPSLESLGYHCEYKRRTGNKLDGCMVAFKLSRFTLVSSHAVEFYRRGIPLMDRDNVGLVVNLRAVDLRGSEQIICVATTHLLYNPRRGDIKLAQLALLMAEISQVAQMDDGSTCPVVLCGDFNSVPASPLYTFIKDSKLEYAGMPIGKVSGQEESHRGQRILTVPIWPTELGVSQLCQYDKQTKEPDLMHSRQQDSVFLNCFKPRIEHRLNLSSVYSHYLKEGGQPEITTCHSRTAITVDYIFYSPLPSEDLATKKGMQLLSRLSLVGEAELQRINGLPNQSHSSDHLPLIAKFRLHC